MTRRALFAALCGLAPAAAVATASEPRAEQPYAHVGANCPQCGSAMMIVTRRAEKLTHDSTLTWTCDRCSASWRIPVQRLAAERVAHDDGRRAPTEYLDEWGNLKKSALVVNTRLGVSAQGILR